MSTGIDTVSETELFQSLDLDEHVECSYDGCDATATHMLECPEDKAAETICPQHAVMFRLLAITDPDQTIHFNHSCGHWNKFGECQIIPLTK